MPIINGIEVPGILEDIRPRPMAIDIQAWQDALLDVPALAGRIKPAPMEQPVEYYDYEFEGMVLRVPDWATHITQNRTGVVQAWDSEPKVYDGIYTKLRYNSKQVTLVAPERYPAILEQL